MGDLSSFTDKSELFSILACHGYTSQRLSILFSENVTPLSVWTNFVSDLDGKRTSNASQTHQFCELEPGQHIYPYTYTYIPIYGFTRVYMDIYISVMLPRL